MQVTDLPRYKLVGSAMDAVGLARLLVKAVEDTGVQFTFVEPILGSPRSGRLLFQRNLSGFEAVQIPQPMSAQEIAWEFFSDQMMRDSRFNPNEVKDQNWKRGWEVGVFCSRSDLVVIVWASWVFD